MPMLVPKFQDLQQLNSLSIGKEPPRITLFGSLMRTAGSVQLGVSILEFMSTIRFTVFLIFRVNLTLSEPT